MVFSNSLKFLKSNVDNFSTSLKFFVPPNLSVIPQLSAKIFPIVNYMLKILQYIYINDIIFYILSERGKYI